jgi:hypothetical protein
MDEQTLEQAIIALVHRLDAAKQRQVLEYAQGLTRPKGEPGELFLQRTVSIHIDADDLRLMEQAIEAEFERVDDLPEVIFGD